MPDRGSTDALPERVTRGAVHHLHLPARPGDSVDLPKWLGADVTDRLANAGIDTLYLHQAEALEWLLQHRRNVVVATGTASGKSLVYQAAATWLAVQDPAATVLYLSPTKALGHDQARAMGWTGLRVGVLDGDAPPDEREWIAAHAQVVVSNPDMLNFSVLPRHDRWQRLLRRLALVVVDECHTYRGVFGAHVALILRRLLRLARAAGADPLIVGASATTARPADTMSALVGASVQQVSEDASPRGPLHVILRDPATEGHGSRREVVELTAALVQARRRTLTFVPSRAGAESVAAMARESTPPELAGSILAYRAGLLPEERRGIEGDLRAGTLLAVATTNALELGVDITGLDAVVLAGWPGRQTSFWQQVGRAGRAGQEALAVLVADDDPLDHYLLHHPEEVIGPVTERTVVDLANPFVLRHQLVAAAAELPLTGSDLEQFDPASGDVAEALVAEGTLRRRPRGLFWPHPGRPPAVGDIRAIGGSGLRIVEAATGRLLGTAESARAWSSLHPGAVYVHQGDYYSVTDLDLEAAVAVVTPTVDSEFTMALSTTEVDVAAVSDEVALGSGRIRAGDVTVTSQVYAYQRRRNGTGELLSTHGLAAPAQTLTTAGVWWSWPAEVVDATGIADVAGAAHAAEHAAIGLLPHFAACDRWDIGGLSTAYHPATGEVTVFVYDGYPGGVGYAQRGYSQAAEWLRSTRDAITGCPCLEGCPRCVQSPKCGNGNNPLDKDGAATLLRQLVG
ncbi:MAG: DUF1998 domain-containing protein [Actinobacteria bacterium]|nr:DUF1998 domain-containing protein [Actinomycetota bacterium]